MHDSGRIIFAMCSLHSRYNHWSLIGLDPRLSQLCQHAPNPASCPSEGNSGLDPKYKGGRRVGYVYICQMKNPILDYEHAYWCGFAGVNYYLCCDLPTYYEELQIVNYGRFLYSQNAKRVFINWCPYKTKISIVLTRTSELLNTEMWPTVIMSHTLITENKSEVLTGLEAS